MYLETRLLVSLIYKRKVNYFIYYNLQQMLALT